ncbi:unnamed protein product [Caenorhabditis sp. 36 PRJEB53466]|nr:unnamed protein product [Caenorhabditis sp. 36 PRJEB53466]
MLTKDDYIQVINQLIAQPGEAWKNDPFEILLKQAPKELIVKYLEVQPEDLVPSTSDDVRTVNADVRIQFSQVLGGVYLDLSSLLKSARESAPDEFQLLSLQDVSAIKKSFEFFVLTAILPFLEPGVGLGATSRSTFIKSWKVYDGNKPVCIERLDYAAKVILALLECNLALAAQFLPKFIDDVLCVRFQLVNLGVKENEPKFVEILAKCPPDVLFASLMLMLPDKKQYKTPLWLKMACGMHMTKILVAKDGLSHLMQYYRERAGDTWTDNLPMTKQVAWHLATVPKLFKHPLQYHEIISNQFFETLWKQKTPEKNVTRVFVSYSDELRVRFSLNCDLTIFDKVLRFWEILNQRIADKTVRHSQKMTDFCAKDVRNLQLLSQLQSSLDPKRIRFIYPVLYACIEHIPFVKDVLKATLEGFQNMGCSLYMHVMTPTRAVQIVKKREETSSKIEEIGENAQENAEDDDEMWLHGVEENADEGIARRLETAFFVVDNVLTQSQVRTMIELMTLGVDDFLKTAEKERDDDCARFVVLEGAKHFAAHHAHLVVGCCFERLVSIADKYGFGTDECVQLLRLAENILNNATGKLQRLGTRKRSVDVFVMSENEQKEFELTCSTARLCVPLVTTVFALTQGMSRLHELHLKCLESVANLTKAVDQFPSQDHSFMATIDEAKLWLRSLKIDVENVNPVNIPQRMDRRRYSHGDVCNELMEELHDDEPAVRGAALMQISKTFRSKMYLCPRLLEYGVFEMAKELIADDDSYVYLSAINAMCEMSLFDRRLLEIAIEYYEEMSKMAEKNEPIIVRLGRLTEALGRVFLVKGAITVNHVDRMAPIFIDQLGEQDEILRASACGGIGFMMRATEGKGFEKWLERLFHALHNIVLLDRSVLSRRAAVDLIRICIHSYGMDVFVTLRERLLELHREVRRLWRTDRDGVVRLHSQLCCEELDAILEQSQAEIERGYTRRIRF